MHVLVLVLDLIYRGAFRTNPPASVISIALSTSGESIFLVAFSVAKISPSFLPDPKVPIKSNTEGGHATDIA